MNFKIIKGLLIFSLITSPAKPDMPTTDQVAQGAFIIAALTGSAFLYSAWNVYQQECKELHQEPNYREFWNFIKDFVQENNLTKTLKVNHTHPKLAKLCLATQAAAGTGAAALAIRGIRIVLAERPQQRSRPGSALSMQNSMNSSQQDPTDLQSDSSGTSERATSSTASKDRRADVLRRQRAREDAELIEAAQRIAERRASIHNREQQGPDRAREDARTAAALAELTQQAQARQNEQAAINQANERKQAARDAANQLQDRRMRRAGKK